MVQHVTFAPSAPTPQAASEPTPSPATAVLWRDDQTLKWGLAPGYSWPNPEGPQPVPIVFLPAIGEYLAWPGDAPTPIGPRPDAGMVDQRFYEASANKVLGLNDPPEKYHYAFVVCSVDDPGCPLTIDPEATQAPQQWQDGEGVWHDPDVENRNQP